MMSPCYSDGVTPALGITATRENSMTETGKTTSTSKTAAAKSAGPVDPDRPESANIGAVDNDPSASETLPQGTVVDPTSGPQGAPSPFAGGKTGYHCGYCGQPVGAEGQHYNSNGETVETPHAHTMVVADRWDARPTKGDDDQPTERPVIQPGGQTPKGTVPSTTKTPADQKAESNK